MTQGSGLGGRPPGVPVPGQPPGRQRQPGGAASARPAPAPGSLTHRGGGRGERPELPTGQLQLQPPPQLQASEGAAGVAMNAIPMLGSLGSIVLVAGLGAGGNSSQAPLRFIAAGMFLFATLGFIIVQIDRQRKQRQQQVSGSRTEYLRYLSPVRTLARDAANHPVHELSRVLRRVPHREPGDALAFLRVEEDVAVAVPAAGPSRCHRPGTAPAPVPGRR